MQHNIPTNETDLMALIKSMEPAQLQQGLTDNVTRVQAGEKLTEDEIRFSLACRRALSTQRMSEPKRSGRTPATPAISTDDVLAGM